MSESMFVAMEVNRNVTAHVDIGMMSVKPITIPLTFADGMIGMIPVFKDRESALAYASPLGLQITEIEPVK